MAVLYDRYHDRLLHFMQRKLSADADPEDYVHDVFIRLVELPNLPDEPHLEHLIFKIARGKTIDAYRQKDTRKTDSHPDLDMHGDMQNPLPDQVLESKQALLHFRHCLDRLPARSKCIFLLHRVSHYTQKEIASRLDISVSAIEKHMVKAAGKLAQCMEKAR